MAGVHKIERMQDIINVVEQRQDRTGAAVNILAVIHPAIPPEIRLESLEIDRGGGSSPHGEVYLTGFAATTPDVSRLREKLDDLDLFRSVRVDGRTTYDPRTKRYRFRLVCPLEN